MRAIRSKVLFALVCISVNLYGQNGPAAIDDTNLAFWLRADVGTTISSGNLTSWADQSPNGNNAANGTSPAYISSSVNWNNKPTVSFSSTSLVIENDATINDGDQSIKTMTVAFRSPSSIVDGNEVIYEQGGGTNGLIYYINGDGVNMTLNMGIYSGDGANYSFQSVSIATNTNYIATFIYDGAIILGYLNNNIAGISSLTGGTTPINPLPSHTGDIRVGSAESTNRGAGITISAGDAFTGEIAEVIQYNRVLNAVELTSVANYLSAKYDIAISNDLYAGDLALNGDYDEDFRLIGNDGVSVVTTSSDDFLTITDAGLGSGDYLAWGNDGASSSLISAAGLTSSYRSGRTWSIDLTGSTTSIDNISFPDAGASNYTLVLDDDENFGTSPIELSPTSTAGGTITFTNVDLSSFGGLIYLTFGADVSVTPGGTASLPTLWFRSDAGVESSSGVAATDTDPVEFWRDQSGNGNNAIQSDLGQRAVWDNSNTINGNPVLSFDGADDHFAIDQLFYNNVNTLDELTIYAVTQTTNDAENIIVSYDRSSFYRFTIPDADDFRLGSNQGTTITDFTSSNVSVGDGVAHILGADFDGVTTGDQNLYFDGARDATTNTGTGFLGNTSELPRYGFIGINSEAETFDGTSSSGDEFTGEIAEIVYYESALSETEKRQLESYLAIKYGITLSNDTDGDAIAFEAGEGDYLAADGTTVVWDADVNSAYHNDIAGLALDADANLSQSNSKSIGSTSIFSVTDNSLNEDEYIMWGHNGAGFSTSPSPTSFDFQFDRIWKVEITGTTNNIDEIEIDLTAAFATSLPIGSSLGLIIADNENFTSATVIPGTAVGTTITFTNVDLSSFAGDIFITGAFTPPYPGNVGSNIAFWYKADLGVEEAIFDSAEDGDAVRFWRDQSGNGYYGEQNASGERPRFDASNTINNNPVLTFDGGTHLPIRDLNYDLSSNTIDDFTIYSIVKSNQASEGIIVSYDRSSFFRFALNHNDNPNFGLSTTVEGSSDGTDDNNAASSASDGFTHLVGGDYTTASDQKNLYLDGVVTDTYNGAHGATGGTLGDSGEVPRFGYIAANSEADSFDGNDSGGGIVGDIAEIVYFEGILTGNERERVESYLAIKYGVTLGSDYVSSTNTTVWDNAANTGYNNDIVGIALDAISTLIQPQSKSEADGSILTISDVSLSDGDYIIFGSDDGDLSVGTAGTGTKDGRFNRIWKYEITGGTDNIDQLLFDLSSVIIKPVSIANYALLIDDADDFNSPVREVVPTSITNGIIQFDGVDLSGASFVSIAITPDLDNDGVADLTDIDDDNDGILDIDEGNGVTDTDADGIVDSRDLDSDNDGIGDLYESGAEGAGTALATLDADGNGMIDVGNEGANGFENLLETGLDNGTLAYTVSNSDASGPVDFRDLDSDNNGISDLVESGRSTSIDSDDDGVFEGTDSDEDGVPDEIDAEDNLFGSTLLIPNNQDGLGEPDFRDLDNDEDGVNDIDEVQLTDGNMDGRLDGVTDEDGDGVIAERDDDDMVFGQINLADLVTGAGIDWYSYRTGDWDDPDSWTQDPSGSTRVNPGGLVPNNLVDNVTILNGDEITLNFNGLVLSSLTVEAGGIVNIGTTINHNLNTISGDGTISLASNEFPGGDASNFVSSSGGTVIYTDQSPAVDYELTVAKTFNNLVINSAANTITQKADLTLNGSLIVRSGTYQINDNISDSYTDNTTPLAITVNGDLSVEAAGAISVGNVDASTQIGTSGVFNFHQLELLGNFTNDGNVSFTNLSNTSITDGRYRDKYPTAADSDNNTGTDDIPAVEFGVVEVLYTNGAADQLNTLNGTTDFYRIEVKKGTSQTFIAEFNASATSNFRLLGRIAMDQSDDSGTTPNIDNHRALGLEAGILKLGDNIVIDQISKEDENGSDPSTQGGNRNYIIDLDAQLWLASNSIVTRSNDWGIHPFGRLKVSDDATLTFTGTGQRTILIDNQGVFEMTGGTVNITQFRNKTGADGAPRGSFIMTGGTMNIGGGGADGNHAIFSVPWEEQNFILTAEDPSSPPVINITIDGNRGKDRAAIQIGSKEGNYNVGQSTFNIVQTENRNFKISSTVPFYNLFYSHAGSDELRISDIEDANDNAPSNASAILPDDNSGTIPSPAAFAQPLIITNDLTISDGRIDANDLDVAVSNLFTISDGGEYDPGANTTFFNGDSPIQNIRLNGASPLVGGGFNNVEFTTSGTTKTLGGDLTTMVVLGNMTIGSGVTFDDNGKVVQVNGNIINSGTHITDFTSPGRIEVTGGSATHTIGGDGNGRFMILTIDDAVNAITLSADQQIDSVLNLVNGPLDVNTNQLTISSTATNPIRDDANGISNFGVTRMIQTAGNASDGGLRFYYDGTTADPSATLLPIGTNANGSIRYTPARANLSNVADDGYLRIRVSDTELQTVDLTALSSNILTYYWRVSHSDFGTLPTMESIVLTADDTDDPDGGATPTDLPTNFVPGKVLDESPFTRSQENTSDVTGLNISFNGAGAGFTLENANYTAGDGTTNLFVGSPEVFYSRATGGAWWEWQETNHWSTDPVNQHLGAAAMDYPQAGDIAVVGSVYVNALGCDPCTDSGTGRHQVRIDGSVGDVDVSELIFDSQPNGTALNVTDMSRVRIRGGLTLSAGKISGTGELVQDIGTVAQTGTITGDLGEFTAERNNGFFFWFQSVTDVTISDRFEYPIFRTFGEDGTLDFSQDITAFGLVVDNGTTMSVSTNWQIDSLVQVGSNGAGTIEFPNVGSNVTLECGTIVYSDDAANNISVEDSGTDIHRLIVNRDVNLDLGTSFNLTSPSGAQVELEVSGAGNHSFINNTGTDANLYRLIVNKGIDQSSTFTFNDNFALNASTSGTTKALEIQNGTLILNNSNLDLDLNGGGGDFTIPSSGAITLQSGTVRMTASGTGTGNGLRLDGKLTISGGNVLLDGGATADNYLEYGSAGGSEIEISAGNLVVGSQLRRNTLSDDGVINYTQTGGTALFGANTAPEDSRGVFEIINSGTAGSSSFNLSGASTIFALVHSQTSPLTGTFIIDSDVNVNLTTDPYIDFGYNGTIASNSYQNDLNETYEINSGVVLPNVRIDNSNFNSPIAEIVVQPLTVTTNLEILNSGSLRSNNFDLTINSGFTNNGTYTPGTNTTIFNGATQTVGGTTNTTFNNLNINPTTSLTLSNPITVNGDMRILTGQLNDNGNRISLIGNLYATTDHISDGTGNGGISLEGAAAQEINLPDGAVSIDKLLIDNANGVTLNDNAGAAVVLTFNDELALENGILFLGDNRIIFDDDAQATTSATFGAERMISVNGVKKSDGVEKQFLASTNPAAFVIPVGTPDKYTPVTLDVDGSDDPGSILVKPINAIHPSATGPDALNYYWLVTTNPTTVTNFTGSVSFQYLESDANNAGQNESTWENNATRLIAPNWFKPSGNLVNITTNVMTFTNSDLSSFGGTTFDGEYTIGNDIPDILAQYRSNTTGIWNLAGNWDIDTDGDGFDDGNGVPQPGTIVIVNTGDEISMASGTDNDQNIFSLQIDGVLDVADSDGHNFGDVSGTGTLRISNSTLPGGNYDNFFTTTAGALDLAGATSYTISPDFASGIRGLTISGGGTKTLPALGVSIGAGGITINDGATLNNALNNNEITSTGNVNINNGTFALGNSSASLSAQDVTLTTGSFTSTGAPLDISGDLNLNGGTFNASGASHSIAGDFNYNSATTFNNESGRITFDGVVDQNITSNSATIDFHNVRIDKSGGSLIVGPNTTVNVNNRLGLLNGSIVNTEGTGVQMRLVGAATYETGSDGFVSGPLFKDLNAAESAFTFRIGKSTTYKPIVIDPEAGSYMGSLTWESEYNIGSADDFVSGENDILDMSTVETNADPDEQVISVNASEYWRVDSGGGSANLEAITLDISNLDITTDDINDQLLQVMVWDETGGEWDHLGGISSGTPTAANVITALPLSFSEKIITSGIESNTTLPVELIYFNGIAENNRVELTWATASEVNNDFFEILRSSDGNDFEVIGTVIGNGNSSEQINYAFLDKNPYSGLSYYRLRQVDFDGKDELHGIIQVVNNYQKAGIDVSTYPNPSTIDNLNIRIITGDNHTKIGLKIIDMNGKSYLNTEFEGDYTVDERVVPTSSMVPGVYFMIVEQGFNTQRHRILIK